MKKDLLKVSIRQNAIYLPPVEGMGEKKKLLVEAGQIMALKDGESTVTFSYKSTFGER